MMLNKQLEYIIDKYKITKTNNIIYGTNIPMPTMVLPTPWKTYIKFDKVEYYFFYFDEQGITIYPINGGAYAKITWDKITSFKISHISILGKMTIKTTDNTYKFQLNRFVFGCPWLKLNRKYLEEHHYFYKGN